MTSIVDVLIEERAPSLTGHRLTARFVRRYLYPLLRYPDALHFAARVHPLAGEEVLDLAASELDLDLRIRGLDNVPATGRAILIANHPTGIADGIALWDALRQRRSDLVFLANADALRVAPRLDGQVVPVDWVPSRRSHAGSRETLKRTARALIDDRLVVTFPSGRLAHLTWRGLRERPWMPGMVNLARKHRAPILPLHITARNSALFYAFSKLSQELRDITLFNELLNKRRQRFALTFGAPVDPATLDADAGRAIVQLRRLVERDLGRRVGDELPPPPRRRAGGPAFGGAAR